ncbi:MAG: AAA family ATPase [Patulibacter sp.]|nr:AAA family ATPase [Patulibacter sp.]
MLADERSSLDPANRWYPKHADAIVRSVYADVAPDHDAYARPGRKPNERVTLTSYATIDRKAARWLWDERIPRGALTMLVGDPGLGKSQLTARLAQVVTAEGGTVLLASAEDSPSYTIVPRLQAAGAVLSRVHHVAITDEHGTEGDIRLPDDLQGLRDQIEAIGGVDLLVVDPVMAHLGGKIDSYKDSDVRTALGPLAQLADDFDCAVVAVAHLNKGAGTNATYRVGGSIGFTAAARSVLLLARDPDGDERGPKRILANTKNNLGPEAASLRCTVEAVLLEPVVVDGHVRQPLTTTSKIVIGDECGISGAMLLAASSGDPNGEPRPAADEAKQFLLAKLEAGPMRSKALLEEAKSAGIKEITLRRAKEALGVVAKQVTGAQHAGWVWALPDVESDAHEDDRLTANEADDHVTDRALDRGDAGDREVSDDASCVREPSPDRQTASVQEGDVNA